MVDNPQKPVEVARVYNFEEFASTVPLAYYQEDSDYPGHWDAISINGTLYTATPIYT
jgi:hypothetical protein